MRLVGRFEYAGPPVRLHSEALAFPLPIVEGGDVSSWEQSDRGVPDAWELVLVADDAVSLDAGAYIASVETHTRRTSQDVSAVDHTAEEFTIVGHGFDTGFGPVRLTTSGGLPTGVALGTDYWVIKLTNDTFQLAASEEDALAEDPVLISTNGTGTQTVHYDEEFTAHVVVQGELHDGAAIDLDEQVAFREVLPHSPGVTEYGLVATVGSGTGAVTAWARPLRRLEQ